MSVAVKTAGNYKTCRWLSRLGNVERMPAKIFRRRDAGVERRTDEAPTGFDRELFVLTSVRRLQLACFLAPGCELFQPDLLQSVFERAAGSLVAAR